MMAVAWDAQRDLTRACCNRSTDWSMSLLRSSGSLSPCWTGIFKLLIRRLVGCQLLITLICAERSASSSGTNTPRLRFADLGGAAWGREAPAAYTSLPPQALHQSLDVQRTGFAGPVTSTAFTPALPLLRPPSSPLASMGNPSSISHANEVNMWGMPVGRPPTLQVYPSIHGGSLWADAERSHSGPQAGDLAPPGVEWGDAQPTSPYARPGSAPGEPLPAKHQLCSSGKQSLEG